MLLWDRGEQEQLTRPLARLRADCRYTFVNTHSIYTQWAAVLRWAEFAKEHCTPGCMGGCEAPVLPSAFNSCVFSSGLFMADCGGCKWILARRLQVGSSLGREGSSWGRSTATLPFQALLLLWMALVKDLSMQTRWLCEYSSDARDKETDRKWLVTMAGLGK